MPRLGPLSSTGILIWRFPEYALSPRSWRISYLIRQNSSYSLPFLALTSRFHVVRNLLSSESSYNNQSNDEPSTSIFTFNSTAACRPNLRTASPTFRTVSKLSGNVTQKFRSSLQHYPFDLCVSHHVSKYSQPNVLAGTFHRLLSLHRISSRIASFRSISIRPGV